MKKREPEFIDEATFEALNRQQRRDTVRANPRSVRLAYGFGRIRRSRA